MPLPLHSTHYHLSVTLLIPLNTPALGWMADSCKLGWSSLPPAPLPPRLPSTPLLHRLPLSVLPSWSLPIGRDQKSNVSYWSAPAAERRHHIRRFELHTVVQSIQLSNTCIDSVKTKFWAHSCATDLQSAICSLLGPTLLDLMQKVLHYSAHSSW